MSDKTDSQRLKLSVTDLGPIARADIDLRPMMVFVGPSNTGKSYLAIMIYALHRFFGAHTFGPVRAPWRRSVFRLPRRHTSHSSYTEAISRIASDLRDVVTGVETGDLSPAFEHVLKQPEALAFLRSHFEEVGDLADLLNLELARVFGITDTAQLIRNGSRTGSRLTITRPLINSGSAPEHFSYEFAVKRSGREFRASIPDIALSRFAMDGNLASFRPALDDRPFRIGRFRKRDEDIQEHVWRILRRTAESIGIQVLNPLTNTSHYLPADRTGVMHAHRVLVGSLIGQASRAGIDWDATVPRLSGVLADFLEELIELDERNDSDIGESLARDIERDVLQGQVSARATQVGYPEFVYRPDGWSHDLLLANTSSMVSELAPIVLYLRHVVQPGDVLMIEEPESHLHPAMQVALTRHLAAAVHAGVRILVTTHSEWVLDELTNLVRLSGLPQVRRRAMSGADYAISADDLGVWLFEPKKRPRGSLVKEIRYDDDFGGFRTGFDEVAIGTYNDHAEITNLIAEGKPEYKLS